MILEHNHTHIRCNDPKASEKWWIDVLGAELDGYGSVPGMPISRLNLGGITIALSPPREGLTVEDLSGKPRWGAYQIAFTVENLDVALEQIKAKGGEVIGAPPAKPNSNVRVAFVQAPDGVEIELMQFT